MIKGLHHISMKAQNNEEFENAKRFYTYILGLSVFTECDDCALFDTGAGYIEIFKNGKESLPKGVIRHFALGVDDVDVYVEKAREAGFEIILEPKDINIGGELPARIAFCKGPLGEEIEFFRQK